MILNVKQSVARALVLAVCVLMSGCSAGEGSSEGMSWHIFTFGPRDNAKPEQLASSAEKIREMPSKMSEVVRHEWGELLTPQKIYNGRYTHALLVTVADNGPVDVLDFLHAGHEGGYVGDHTHVTDIHDETPDAWGSTRGHLRRLMSTLVEIEDSERIQKLEAALNELPSKIPAIERLQWGVKGRHKHSDKNIDRWYVLFTFEDAAARDAFLADPAYKEFEKLLDRRDATEYISTDSWSFPEPSA